MHDLLIVVKSINSFVGRYGCILHIIENCPEDFFIIYKVFRASDHALLACRNLRGGGGGNAILGYFRPYLSRAIFGFLRCTWPKIALKLKQVNICSSN